MLLRGFGREVSRAEVLDMRSARGQEELVTRVPAASFTKMHGSSYAGPVVRPSLGHWPSDPLRYESCTVFSEWEPTVLHSLPWGAMRVLLSAPSRFLLPAPLQHWCFRFACPMFSCIMIGRLCTVWYICYWRWRYIKQILPDRRCPSRIHYVVEGRLGGDGFPWV